MLAGRSARVFSLGTDPDVMALGSESATRTPASLDGGATCDVPSDPDVIAFGFASGTRTLAGKSVSQNSHLPCPAAPTQQLELQPLLEPFLG